MKLLLALAAAASLTACATYEPLSPNQQGWFMRKRGPGDADVVYCTAANPKRPECYTAELFR